MLLSHTYCAIRPTLALRVSSAPPNPGCDSGEALKCSFRLCVESPLLGAVKLNATAWSGPMPSVKIPLRMFGFGLGATIPAGLGSNGVPIGC